MTLGPGHRVSSREIRLVPVTISFRQCERRNFICCQLLSPKLAQLLITDVSCLSRAFFMRDVLSDCRFVSAAFFLMRIQKLACLFVDFAMPFRKALAQFASNLGNLEIATRCVFDRVPRAAQRTAEFMIIDILGVLLRAEHFVVLQRLPTT